MEKYLVQLTYYRVVAAMFPTFFLTSIFFPQLFLFRLFVYKSSRCLLTGLQLSFFTITFF